MPKERGLRLYVSASNKIVLALIALVLLLLKHFLK
jgi:hypothetical protein